MKTKKAIFLGVTLLVMASLMLPVGCAEEAAAPTPTSTEFKTFSKYGFSFEYPRGYSISEMGLLESVATDSSGIVQALRGDYEVYQVAWMGIVEDTWEFTGDLQTTLEDAFWGMEQAEMTASLDRGELVETTKVGHQMLYQYYTLTYTTDVEGYGIQGVFYCNKSERFFQLTTIHNAISAKQDILEDFQRFLDSLVCH